jgi:hypothetical protein
METAQRKLEIARATLKLLQINALLSGQQDIAALEAARFAVAAAEVLVRAEAELPKLTTLMLGLDNFDFLLKGEFSDFFFKEDYIRTINFKHLLMVDWDINLFNEKDCEHYTISSLEEAKTRLATRATNHPSERWALYQTPGGAHAFRISHRTTAEEGKKILGELGSDPVYIENCFASPYHEGGFSCRISKKMYRQNDYVASFIGCYGRGAPLKENEDSLRVMDLFTEGLGYNPAI